MMFEIIRFRITPKNIKDFRIIDDRIKHPTFIKDRKFLEKEMVAFQKGKNTRPEYPQRYDLTVFTYNQFEKPFLVVDGSHRLEGLKRIFKRKELKEFNAILIPSNVLGANTREKRVAFSRTLDQLLIRDGLPTWVKKYDFAFKEHETISTSLGLEKYPQQEFLSWSNKNRIDTGNANAPTMPIDEYQKTREL
jgi:hypothetical protein